MLALDKDAPLGAGPLHCRKSFDESSFDITNGVPVLNPLNLRVAGLRNRLKGAGEKESGDRHGSQEEKGETDHETRVPARMRTPHARK